MASAGWRVPGGACWGGACLAVRAGWRLPDGACTNANINPAFSINASINIVPGGAGRVRAGRRDQVACTKWRGHPKLLPIVLLLKHYTSALTLVPGGAFQVPLTGWRALGGGNRAAGTGWRVPGVRTGWRVPGGTCRAARALKSKYADQRYYKYQL